jgi:hypothetical protein
MYFTEPIFEAGAGFVACIMKRILRRRTSFVRDGRSYTALVLKHVSSCLHSSFVTVAVYIFADDDGDGFESCRVNGGSTDMSRMCAL